MPFLKGAARDLMWGAFGCVSTIGTLLEHGVVLDKRPAFAVATATTV